MSDKQTAPPAELTRASLELLYHISRELASDLDLHTVLQRVLMLSLRSIQGNSGSIIVLDANGDPVDSAMVHTGQLYDHTTRQLRSTLDTGLAGWVMRQREMVIIPDTSRDERWEKRRDDAPDRTGAKSAVGVPLLARDELVGVMTLVHPTPGIFTAEHGELMRTISDMAGIAILNARLYEDSQRQARVMSALAESAVALTGALGTEDILQRVLEQTHLALRVEAVSLALVNKDRDALTIRAATGNAANKVVGLSIAMGEGISGWVASEGKPAVVPNAHDDPRFDPRIDLETGFETRAITCAPIRSQGEVIGVLEAFNPIDGAFDKDATLVLQGLGSLAGSVIRHGQLFDRMQAAHKSFQELFEDSIDPIFITDWNGRIAQFNRRARETLGIDARSLRSAAIADLHAFDETKIPGGFYSRLTAHETITYESVLKTADQEIPIQVYVRQIILENREYLQWILRDISERKHLDSLRDDLLGMIYHDLRSPLANVIYSMDVMESMLPEDDDASRSLIDVAVRSTERIQRLTSSLLDIKTLEAGQPIVNKVEADVRDIFQYAVDAVQPLSESKAQKVSVDIAPGLPNPVIDVDMIRRVVINLLENAVKYTPPNGEVTLGARAVPEGVGMWVQDNGPGIPVEQQKSIFNKYARLHADGTGIGLGLAFCRLAVEGHGGRIWVESEQGAGSRFQFLIPITV
jgi:PAS domain S-box-containing protein